MINTESSLIERQTPGEEEEDDDFFEDDEEDDPDEEDEEDEEDLYENDLPANPSTSRRSSKWIHTPTSPNHQKSGGTLSPLALQKINAIIKRFPKIPKSIPHQSEAKPRSKTINNGTTSALEWASGLWKK